MATGTNVLWVDDDPAVRDAAAPALERVSDDVTVTVAATVSDARSRLDERADDVDCVVSEYDLPETNGLEFFETVRERLPGVPFILCPGSGSETIASDAIGAGVTDYVPKQEGRDRPGELATRITSAVADRPATRTRRERELDPEYETILETAPTKLFVLDADARIGWMNATFAAGFEESRADLLGTRFPTLIDRGYFDEQVTTQYVEEVRKLLSSEFDLDRAEYDVQFRTADGDERVYAVHTKLLPFEDGEFAGTIHAMRDITRRRRYQHELERRNERLEEFASFVSHDLRNPLNVAQGSLALLEDGADGSHLDDIRWSLSRMAELVDDLLELARHGTAVDEQEWVSLVDVATDAWATIETGDARLEIDRDRVLYADESRLRELFENLFRNAVEHGTPGGENAPATDRLTVAVGPLPASEDVREIDSGPDGADAATAGFYVADSGSGLPPDRESIFEFGHTTAADGTGIGLAIVEEIVTAHGWSIAARDAADGGARFEIEGVRSDESETAIESPDA